MESLLHTIPKSFNYLHAKFQLPISNNVDFMAKGLFFRNWGPLKSPRDPSRGVPGTYFGGMLFIHAHTHVHD